MKPKRVLLIAVLAYLSLSVCSAQARDAEQALERKYGQTFKVQRKHFMPDLARYRMEVNPSNDPSLVFTLDYDPKTGHTSDSFVQTVVHRQGQDYIETLLGDKLPEVALLVATTCSDDSVNPNSFDLESVLRSNPKKISFNIFLHRFEDPNENSIILVRALDQHLRNLSCKRVGLTVSFFDKASLKGLPVSKHSFGFMATSPESFETINQKLALGRLRYRLDPKVPKTPDFREMKAALDWSSTSLKFHKL